MGKFLSKDPHPSVNEDNTFTDEEMMSKEFRAEVQRLKRAIRLAIGLTGSAGLNMAHFWSAMRETVCEVVEAYSGLEHAEQYAKMLEEFNDWQNTRPVTNPEIRRKNQNQMCN